MLKIIIISIFLFFIPFSSLIKGEGLELSKEHLKQGVFFIKDNQLEKAIDEFKKAIELNPAESAAYYNLGLCYLRLKCFKEAIEPLEKYIESHSDSAFAHYNLGCAYSKTGQETEALEEYNRALQLNPDLANR